MERLILSNLSEKPKTQDPTDGDLIKGHFLAEGQTLNQVRNRDQEALQILRYTHKEIADLVRDVYRAWSNLQNTQFIYHTPFQKDISVTVKVTRGLKPCPWKENKRPNLKDNPSNVDFHLTYNHITIVICGLLAHLIEDHGFFEGRPPYRVAPEKIVEFLGTEKVPGSLERAKSLPL